MYRVPLHKDLAVVRPLPPIDFVRTLLKYDRAHFGGATADASPTVLGAGAGPESAKSVWKCLIFHRDCHWKCESIATLDGAGVVHSPQDSLCRHPAVGRHCKCQRHAEVAIPQARHKSVNLLLVPIVFPYPHPDGTVEIPSTLEILWLVRSFIAEIQIVVRHLQDGLPISLFVSRPHVIGMVVWCDVNPLLLCPSNRRREQGRKNHNQGHPMQRKPTELHQRVHYVS